MADLTEPSRPVRRAAGSEAGHKFTTGSPRTQAAADVDGRRSDRGPIGRQERPARRGLRDRSSGARRDTAAASGSMTGRNRRPYGRATLGAVWRPCGQRRDCPDRDRDSPAARSDHGLTGLSAVPHGRGRVRDAARTTGWWRAVTELHGHQRRDRPMPGSRPIIASEKSTATLKRVLRGRIS